MCIFGKRRDTKGHTVTPALTTSSVLAPERACAGSLARSTPVCCGTVCFQALQARTVQAARTAKAGMYVNQFKGVENYRTGILFHIRGALGGSCGQVEEIAQEVWTERRSVSPHAPPLKIGGRMRRAVVLLSKLAGLIRKWCRCRAAQAYGPKPAPTTENTNPSGSAAAVPCRHSASRALSVVAGPSQKSRISPPVPVSRGQRRRASRRRLHGRVS